MTKQYISTTETAALIRKQLKAKFPAVKFSVKSHKYSGGSSINVDWTDGPTGKQVDAIIQPFCGGRFDGMIDMAHSVDSYLLPDGSAAYAKSRGTGGSGGSDPGYDYAAPCEGATLVRFGVDHVFSHRGLSDAFKARVVEAIAAKFSPSNRDAWLQAWNAGNAYNTYVVTNAPGEYHWSLENQIHQVQAEMEA